MKWFLHKRYHSKKFYLFVVLLLLPLILASVLFPNTPAYANLLPNPGCETNTGNWSGWNSTLSRSTSVFRSGVASCLATRTTGTYYTIDDTGYTITNPKQGDTYVGSVWVRSDNAVGKSVQVIVRLDEGLPSQRLFTTTSTLTTSWQKLTVSATVDTASRASVDFYVVQLDAVTGNAFYADDMELLLNPASSSQNLVKNPGFESGQDNWQHNVRGTAAGQFYTNLSEKNSEQASGQLTVTTSSSAPQDFEIAQYGLPLVAGRTYNVSFWARANGTRTMDIVLQRGSSPFTEYLRRTVNLTTTWQQYTYSFVAPSGIADPFIGFQVGRATGIYYVDDVYVGEGPPPAPSGVPSDWCNDTTGVTCTNSWGSRKKITINNTASAAHLTNFPILVKLDSSRIDYGKTQNAGQDIRFVDPSDRTTVLNHEVETWNESGASYVWVKVPQIDAGSTTDYIWMYYNNSSVGSPSTQLGSSAHAIGTWDSSYRGVYHLNQDPAVAGTGGIVDSTNQNNATDNGSMNAADSVNGKIGKALDFDGTDDFIDFGTTGNLYTTNASQITITAWGSLDDTTAHTIVGGGSSAGINNEFWLNSSAELEYWESSPRSSNYGSVTALTGALSTGAMNHYAMTLDVSNDQGRFYFNRNLVKSFSYTPTNIPGKQSIGKYGTASDFWDGVLDEVRISHTVRSADWIEAEYLTMSDGMNSYGTEESLSTAPTLVKAINFNGSALDVDGIAYQAESTAGVTFPNGVTRFANTSVTLNPTASTNKTSMIRDSVWRGSNVQLNVDVTIPNGSYSIYVYTWEDNGNTTYNIGFENQIVASNLNSGTAGTWKKLGPYPVTVVDGKLSFYQTGGDFNLSGMEIYGANGGETITYSPVTQRGSYSSPSDSTGSSLTLNKPSGTIEGDVMVAHVVVNSASTTITTPTGWTLLRRDNTSGSMASIIFYKVAGASEPSSYNWSFGTSRNSAGGIATYYNVDTSTPIDAHNGQYNQDTSTMTAPSITTTLSNGRLLYIAGASASSSVSGPSGMTQQWRVGSSSMSYLAERAVTTAGPTGNVTATNTLTGESNTAALVALRPKGQVAGPDYSTITLRSTSQANNGAGSTSLTISKPTGAISGDVLVAQIIAGTPATTIAAPAGWTLIRRDNSNLMLGVALYYKVLTNNEPVSYTWGLSPSNIAVGGIAAYYNVDVLDPIEAHSGQFNQSAQAMTAPSITTSTPNNKLLFFGAVAVNATVTTPTGFTTQWNTGSQRISHLSDRNLTNPGATGNVVGQHSQPNESNISQLVALRPVIAAAPTYAPLPGSITNLNFGLQNFNPWIQTVCGDFRMDDGFENPVPASQRMMITNASCSSPGVVYSGDTTASFGGGQSSTTGHVVGGYAYPEVYAPSASWGIATSYDYLKQKSQSGGVASTNLATICPTLSNCTLPAGLARGIYYANGNVGLNTYTFPAGQDYVFLIDGNLTFLGNVLVPVNSDTSVVYSVSGNIIIPTTVGVAPTVTTPNLSGIFSTDGSFILQSTNSCNDLRVNIAGAVVVNAGRRGGTLQNDRDLCGNNLTNPSMQITQRLDMVLTMPEFVKLQRITSEEVAP